MSPRSAMLVQIALCFKSDGTGMAWVWPLISVGPYMLVKNTGFSTRNIAVRTNIFSGLAIIG